MRTLHVGLRVSDRERSLAFYEAIGYAVVGTVPGTGIGHLTMLKLPADEFVSLELVHDGKPVSRGTDLSHLVVQVESFPDTLAPLAARGIVPVEPVQQHDGGMSTAFIVDPDGRRIELVQWPDGHPDGLTAADWDDSDS